VAKKIAVIVTYDVRTGTDGSYDGCALYDGWSAAVKDIKAALDRGRQVLIERELMTQAEYDALDNSTDDDLRQLRGEPEAANAVREDSR